MVYNVTGYKTETYRTEQYKDYCFDIVSDNISIPHMYHAWLYRPIDGQVKMYMFSFEKRECKSKQEFINVVEANIKYYIEGYKHFLALSVND